MTTWILRHPVTPGPALRVAVKDLIDVAEEPTTAASRAVEAKAWPATRDAACLGGLRAAIDAGEACYVGKTNLHELAYGISGVNPAFGTPVNPLDPRRVPGGSSSGSAAAVAAGEADVAYGTDTGGSVRIPAACCGIAGLKTTLGRIPVQGVRPLAPTLDTVGPLARDVAGLAAGMALLEPGFAPGGDPVRRVGRVRLPADPAVDAAVDAALAATGWEVVEVDLDDLDGVLAAAMAILDAEAWAVNGDLAVGAPADLGADVLARLQAASATTAEAVAAARRRRLAWIATLGRHLGEVDVLALPTLLGFPPLLEDADSMAGIRGPAAAVNLAGFPALALPVPSGGPLPASLQLVGPAGGEERLLVAGAVAEEAAASLATR
ncbi:MAG TPA: amidase [Acidimicrobiales bacterium]|nr:amidase [Acidimicrobiales bacterium]